jgi:hypothetical protein
MHLEHWYLIVFLALTSVTAPAGAGPASQPTGQKSTQTQEKPPASAAKINPGDLPVSLDRIQRALAHTPMLRFDDTERPVFRVEVFGEMPTLEDILGPDWARGPVKHGSLTHQEFLDMVTPKDVQGYAAFSNDGGRDGGHDVVSPAVDTPEGDPEIQRDAGRTRACRGAAGRHRRVERTRSGAGQSRAAAQVTAESGFASASVSSASRHKYKKRRPSRSTR